MIMPSNRSKENGSGKFSFLRIFKVKNGNKSLYSQGKGIGVMLIFSVLLWWFPIFGASIAGYLGGRKSGNVKRAVISSLVISAIFILLGYSMMPFRSGIIKSVGNYLLYGLVPVSSSSLVSASNLMTYFYSSYGVIYTFTILVPSSVIILIIFSIIGGYVTDMKESEKKVDSGESEKDLIDVPGPQEEEKSDDDNKYSYL